MNTIDELRRDWPNWSIWVTGTLWIATRRGPRPETPPDFFSPRGEPAATLIENSPDELLTALKDQATIDQAITDAPNVDHDHPHPPSPACPLGCLGLKVQTERALLAHWVFGGRYVPTVADLVTLRDNGDLDYVPGIGRCRITEITNKLRDLDAGAA